MATNFYLALKIINLIEEQQEYCIKLREQYIKEHKNVLEKQDRRLATFFWGQVRQETQAVRVLENLKRNAKRMVKDHREAKHESITKISTRVKERYNPQY